MEDKEVAKANLKKMSQELTGKIFFFQEECRTWIYREKVIVIELKAMGFAIGLDVLSVNDISLISRNERSHIISERVFGKGFSDGKRIHLIKEGRINHLKIERKIPNTISYSLIDIIILIIEVIEREVSQLINFDQVSNLVKNIEDMKESFNTKLSEILSSSVFPSMSVFYKKNHLSMMDTLDNIIKNELSLARFGDGEFNLMLDVTKDHYFQKNSDKLNHYLKKVISYNYKDGLLVGIPSMFLERPWWKNYWRSNWSTLQCYLTDRIYGDSIVTRPEFFSIHGMEGVNKWKELWDNKTICFISGKGSRFDIDHDLFNNAQLKVVMHSLPTNAFDDIENIISQVKAGRKFDLYMIALGPSGTILAGELHQLGYRALDVGHITNSYDHVFKGAGIPERIPYKPHESI